MRPSQSVPILSEKALRSVHHGDWSTIDWLQDIEAAEEEKRKREHGDDAGGASIITMGQGWFAAALAGVLMGVVAVAIEICTHFVVSIRAGICVGHFWLNEELCCPNGGECEEFQSWSEFFGGSNSHHKTFVNLFMYVFWGMVFCGIAALFCRHFSAFGAGGGINEVKTIVSGHVVNRYFDRWTMFVKGVGVCMSTGSGLAVGKEGPFVHLGACCGDAISGIFPAFRNEALRRDLISAGAGGGLAVAFGAPIGGVVFAIEEISSFFTFKSMMQSLICGVSSVLVVKVFDIMHTGRIVQFSVDYHPRWFLFEIPAFVVIGAVGGLIGALYNVINMSCVRRRSRLYKKWPVAEVLVLIVISNILNFFVPLCKGGLLELLAELFRDCSTEKTGTMCATNDATLMVWLILAGCVKFGLSVFTVGSCVPAGLLVPSLVIGGLFGRAFGIFVNSLTDHFFPLACDGLTSCVMPGAYAIVGAAAVLTGVTRMTVCLAVIMFELTGSIDYLVPVVISIVSAKWAAEAVGVDSIYELGIEMKNLPYLDPKKEFNHPYTAQDIIVGKGREYTRLYASGSTLEDLNTLLEEHPFSGFPIVESEDDSTLVGYISRHTLIQAVVDTTTRRTDQITKETQVYFRDTKEAPDDYALDFSSYVESSCLQVAPTCSVVRLLQLFKSLGNRLIIITEFSQFKGIVTKKDLIDFMRAKEHEWEKMGDEE